MIRKQGEMQLNLERGLGRLFQFVFRERQVGLKMVCSCRVLVFCPERMTETINQEANRKKTILDGQNPIMGKNTADSTRFEESCESTKKDLFPTDARWKTFIRGYS